MNVITGDRRQQSCDGGTNNLCNIWSLSILAECHLKMSPLWLVAQLTGEKVSNFLGYLKRPNKFGVKIRVNIRSPPWLIFTTSRGSHDLPWSFSTLTHRHNTRPYCLSLVVKPNRIATGNLKGHTILTFWESSLSLH